MKFFWIQTIIYQVIFANERTSISSFKDQGIVSPSNKPQPEDLHRIKCNNNPNYPFEQYNKEDYNYNQKLSEICDVKKYLAESKRTLTNIEKSVVRQEIREITEACKFLTKTKYISDNFKNFKTTLSNLYEKIQNIIKNEKSLHDAIISFVRRKNQFLSQWTEFNEKYEDINYHIKHINEIFDSIDKSIKVCFGNVKKAYEYRAIIRDHNIKTMLDYHWKVITEETNNLKDACDNNKSIPDLDESVITTSAEFSQILSELNDQMSEIDEKYSDYQDEKTKYQHLLSKVENNERIILTNNAQTFLKNYEDMIKMSETNKVKREYWNNYIKMVAGNFLKLSPNEKESIENMIRDLNIHTNENIDENNTIPEVKKFAESLQLKIEKLKSDSLVIIPKTKTDLRNIENTLKWIEALQKIYKFNFYGKKNDYEHLYKGNSIPSDSYTINRYSNLVSKYIDDINTLTEDVNINLDRSVQLFNSASFNMNKIERQGEKLKQYYDSLNLNVESSSTNDTEGVNKDISTPITEKTVVPNKKDKASIEKDLKIKEIPNNIETSSKMKNKTKVVTIFGVILGILIITVVVIGVVFYKKRVKKINT